MNLLFRNSNIKHGVALGKNVCSIDLLRAILRMTHSTSKYLLILLVFLAGYSSLMAQDCSQCPDSSFQTEFYMETDNTMPENGDFVCYTIYTNNFSCVQVLQLFIKFTENTLGNPVFDANLGNLPWFNASIIANNEVRILLQDLGALPNSLPDSSAFAELCFTVIGNPSEEMKVAIGGTSTFPDEIAYANDDVTISCTESNNEPLIRNGVIETTIFPSCSAGFQVFANSLCGTQVGRSTGTARIDFFCGVPPYEVILDGQILAPTSDSSLIVTGLPAGVHTYTVTDGNGEMTSPDQFFTNTNNPLVIDNAILSDPDCATNGIRDGFIELQVSGGFPFRDGYAYDWGGVETGISFEPDITGQTNGTFIVRVSDSLRCEIADTFMLSTDTIQLANWTVGPSTCDGVNTGTLNLEASGDTEGAGYRFFYEATLNDGSLRFGSMESNTNTVLFTDLASGTYLVSVEDQSVTRGSCESDPVEIVIDNEQNYGITTSPNMNANCIPGEQSVIIDVQQTTPGGSFSYQITEDNTIRDSGMNITTSRITTTCLPLGAYQIEIMDANMCVFVDSLIIDGCDLFLGDPITIEPDCLDPNGGAIILNIVNGSSSTQIMWDNDSTTTSISNLSEGLYSVTITDDMCSDSATYELFEPIFITVEFDVDSITCPGGVTDIEVIPQGGFEPYTYSWDPDPLNIPFSTLADATAGTYTVTVTDDDGCEEVASITVSDPEAPEITIDSATLFGPDCMGNGGALFMQVQGNQMFQGPFSFLASSGDMNPMGFSFNPVNLESGEQWILVSTQPGCDFDTFFVDVPDPPVISLDTAQSDFGSIECNGDLTDVFLFAQGISNPSSVNFNWPAPFDQDMGFFKTGVSAGTYAVTLTSGICTSEVDIEVIEPDSFGIIIDRNLSDLPLCADDLAELITTRRGGEGDITYSWTNQNGDVIGNTADLSDLGPGMYSVAAIDTNGCSSVDSIDLPSITPVEAFVGTPIQPLCFGDPGFIFIDSVRGGSGEPYRYQVDAGANPLMPITDTATVQSGDHFVLIADRNGCDVRVDFNIRLPEEVSISLSADPPEIELGTPGEIFSDVISPVAIDTIIWEANGIEPIECLTVDCSSVEIAPVNDQLFTATVITVDGCTAQTDILINVLRSENIYVANVFNPNSVVSDRNRTLQVYTGSGVEALDFFRIYDRWGNLVHQESNLPVRDDGLGTGGWDGTLMNNGISGDPLEPGVYVWVLQARFLGDPNPQIRKGDVTLIR